MFRACIRQFHRRGLFGNLDHEVACDRGPLLPHTPQTFQQCRIGENFCGDVDGDSSLFRQLLLPFLDLVGHPVDNVECCGTEHATVFQFVQEIGGQYQFARGILPAQQAFETHQSAMTQGELRLVMDREFLDIEAGVC